MTQRSLALSIASLCVAGAFSFPALADHDEDHKDKPIEVYFMVAYDKLAREARDFFDNGPYAGFAFNYAVLGPHKKGGYRSIEVRLTAGYAGFNGKIADTKLKGTFYDVDGLLVWNAGKIVKPYLFFGFGGSNMRDDVGIVDSTGLEFDYGIGSKFFFGSTFTTMFEVSGRDYLVNGSANPHISDLPLFQIRAGLGARF